MDTLGNQRAWKLDKRPGQLLFFVCISSSSSSSSSSLYTIAYHAVKYHWMASLDCLSAFVLFFVLVLSASSKEFSKENDQRPMRTYDQQQQGLNYATV